MPHLYIFGDSITWGAWDLQGGGWVQRLRSTIDHYQLANEHFWMPLYNLGISGDTSVGVAGRLPTEIATRFNSTDGCVVIIAIGINDSSVRLSKDAHSVTPEEYRTNLQKIVRAARMYTEKIFLVGLTPVQASRLSPAPWGEPVTYPLSRAREFNAVLGTVAKAEGAGLIEIWEDWMQRDLSDLFTDGLHPNENGHTLLFHSVLNRLIAAGVLPSAVGHHF